MSRSKSSLSKEELVNVSAINQFLYCPRRYWYIYFYDSIGKNHQFKDGIVKHENKAKRGNWTEEIYLESTDIGLKGKIDILEDEELVPVERKRGEKYYDNDIMQVAGYCYLLEKCTGKSVDSGIIYLYKTDQRVRIPFDPVKKKEIRKIISEIHDITSDSPPPFTDNPNKCKKCSTREYCMPAETAKLEPEKVSGTGWEDEI
jgi:CRISPR-associated exonuclease Cas4